MCNKLPDLDVTFVAKELDIMANANLKKGDTENVIDYYITVSRTHRGNSLGNVDLICSDWIANISKNIIFHVATE